MVTVLNSCPEWYQWNWPPDVLTQFFLQIFWAQYHVYPNLILGVELTIIWHKEFCMTYDEASALNGLIYWSQKNIK
jgi:hypothetical protein